MRQGVGLLDLDPELGGLLDAEARARAARDLAVRVASLRPGHWDVGSLAAARRGHLGLLVLEGVIARETVLDGEVSAELLGQGDLIRPWSDESDASLLGAEVRWNVLAETRLAVLDDAFAARAAGFPGVASVLVERVDARARRAATLHAICHLTRVEDRLLALLRHLSERWGKVTREGVVLPLALSHRSLAELIAVRRPSLSTAAGGLARRGVLTRRPDGSWLLRGALAERQAAGAPESVSQRRHLLVTMREPAPAPRVDRLRAPRRSLSAA
jgi:CRP/FNR family transcriptional regulator, cyclic AMP receptor protein